MKKYAYLFAVLAAAVLFAACGNILNPVPKAEAPKTAAPGYGNVSVYHDGNINANARTIMPTMDFESYDYRFNPIGGTNTTVEYNNQTSQLASFTVPVGDWTVTVSAFKTISGTRTLAAQGTSAAFTVSGSGTASATVKLDKPTGVTADGYFEYNITFPDDAELTVKLYNAANMAVLIDNTFDSTTANLIGAGLLNADAFISFSPGMYLLSVTWERDGVTGGDCGLCGISFAYGDGGEYR